MSSNNKPNNSLTPDHPQSLRRRSTTSLFHPEKNIKNLPAIELDPSSEIGTKLASLHLEPFSGCQPPPQSLKNLCFHRECPYQHASAINPKLALQRAREVREELEKENMLSKELVAYLKEPQGRKFDEDRHNPLCPVAKLVAKAAEKFKDGLGKAQLAPPPQNGAENRD